MSLILRCGAPSCDEQLTLAEVHRGTDRYLDITNADGWTITAGLVLCPGCGDWLDR